MNRTSKWKELSDKFAQELYSILNDNLIGVYLTGSAVFDDWYEDKSDIDLTVFIDKSIQESDINILNKLCELYKELQNAYPKVKLLEIQYIPSNILEKHNSETVHILEYHDKKQFFTHFHDNPVTWFTLKNHGIVIYGKPIEELNLQTTTDELIEYVQNNVNTYWSKWVSDCEKLFSPKGILSLSDWGIEWCICGISRIYYTLREKDITSKRGAAEYMLNIVPQKYRIILKEALSIRTNQKRKQYISVFKRRKDMIEYVNHVISMCNTFTP